ncbi:hypothetical protein VTK73DRAFT_3049 [Phialemonium thermophilum]|uniref:Alpha/beta hydrolase fold-3 domain-containing protein n=1 Tax=Phialemonium thermophilum TaxID=223376 RepID=A0ABR3VP72_9PEZI
MDFSQYGVPSLEWQTFIKTNPEAGLPASFPPDLAPEQIQAGVNAMQQARMRALFDSSGLASRIDIRDHQVPTRDGSAITIREYRPKDAEASDTSGGELPLLGAIVHFHGGGFLFGSLESELVKCATAASSLGVVVLHVCYRHTPAFTHPTAHHDAEDGTRWIASQAESLLRIDTNRIVVHGPSAGASVAASTAMTLLKDPQLNLHPRGLVLPMPWLVHKDVFPVHLFTSREIVSQVQCADAPGLSMASIDYFTDLLKVQDPQDPLLNMALRSDEELRLLPKTAIMVSGNDPLRDEGLLLATRLKKIGVRTKVHIFQGLPHTFRLLDGFPSNARYDTLLVESLKWTLDEGSADSPTENWVVEQ